jgi:hypothetical protein
MQNSKRSSSLNKNWSISFNGQSERVKFLHVVLNDVALKTCFMRSTYSIKRALFVHGGKKYSSRGLSNSCRTWSTQFNYKSEGFGTAKNRVLLIKMTSIAYPTQHKKGVFLVVVRLRPIAASFFVTYINVLFAIVLNWQKSRSASGWPDWANWTTFSHCNRNFEKNGMGWALFCAIFSQTHLVTLISMTSNSVLWRV